MLDAVLQDEAANALLTSDGFIKNTEKLSINDMLKFAEKIAVGIKDVTLDAKVLATYKKMFTNWMRKAKQKILTTFPEPDAEQLANFKIIMTNYELNNIRRNLDAINQTNRKGAIDDFKAALEKVADGVYDAKTVLEFLETRKDGLLETVLQDEGANALLTIR